jgi:hypothetical protein
MRNEKFTKSDKRELIDNLHTNNYEKDVKYIRPDRRNAALKLTSERK